MTRTPTNPQIIATIEKGILLKKRLANPSIPFDTPVFANVAAAFAAAMNDYTSALLFRASELAARGDSAVQQLMHHWKMTEEEVNGRLKQIADANPGDWADKSAHRVWVYVLAGFTFDDNGKLELENSPLFFKPKFEYAPKLNFNPRFIR